MRLTPVSEMSSATSQLGIWARQRGEARAALVTAANALAPLSDSEEIDPSRWAKHRDEPSPSAVQETVCSAIIAEGVLALVARVESLEAEVNALKGR